MIEKIIAPLFSGNNEDSASPSTAWEWTAIANLRRNFKTVPSYLTQFPSISSRDRQYCGNLYFSLLYESA